MSKKSFTLLELIVVIAIIAILAAIIAPNKRGGVRNYLRYIIMGGV